MIKEVFDVSVQAPRRTQEKVFLSLVEEIGELATELSIEAGHSKKVVGEDGVTGEAVDVILCALDLIWVHNDSTAEEELEQFVRDVVNKKLAKWKRNFK